MPNLKSSKKSVKQDIKNKADLELIQLFFKELGDTRNYYSHIIVFLNLL